MNKISYFIVSALALAAITAKAQVKIGNNPTVVGQSSALEIESPNKALLLPRVTNTTAVTSPVNGMMVYDLSTQSTRVYQNGAWSALPVAAATTLRVNCDDTGFTGAYNANIALSGTNLVVRILNNSGSTVTFTPAASDVTLSGVSGLTVGTPSGGGGIGNGSSTLVYYPISGTPQSSGTLKATFSRTLSSPSVTLSCTTTKAVKPGTATFGNFPIIRAVGSMAGSPGVINNANPITISIPYTGGSGNYAAYTSPVATATGQAGDTNGFSLSYAANSFSTTPNRILVTVLVDGDGVFNVKQLPQGVEEIIASLPLQVNGDLVGSIILKAVGGVTDSYGNVYMTVDFGGYTWLNNNLGADYANPNKVVYNPMQQATSRNDFQAFGSIFQWGRRADGHELINWTSSTGATSVYGTTTTRADVPSTPDFILYTAVPFDWRLTQNNTLWDPTVAGNNNPCPAGFKVPTLTELSALGTNALTSSVKLSGPGYRSNPGTFQSQPGGALYWTSSIDPSYPTNARYVAFSTGSLDTSSSGYRYQGMPVRCVKAN